MRILVTGSAGHLGEALVRVLGADHDVVGLDVLDAPFTTLTGSVADRDVVRRAMDGVDAVLHTATLHKPHVGTHGRQRFVYARLGRRMFPAVERVYVNSRACRDLGWEPRHGFRRALDAVAAGQDMRSPLSVAVGAKGYHAESTGPYTVR